MGQLSRSCRTCGETIQRTKPTGPIPPYCSETCRPRCSVEGCTNPKRKREWCSSHYSQWKTKGEVSPLHHTWTDELVCVVCGSETGLIPGFRKFCSDRCKRLWQNHDGQVPDSVTCELCKRPLSLTERGKAGRRRRCDTKLCRRCKSDRDKHGMSVFEIVARDGLNCGICGEPVDMTLQRSALSASIDRIIPRARGGTNDPANLQLAHQICNERKSDRIAVP